MTRRVVANPLFEAAALRSKEVRDKLLELAERGAEIASSHAPDDPETPASEDLAGGFVVEVVMTPGGWRGRIIGKNYKTPFYEFGTIQNAPQPMLRPAVEELGLELDDKGAGEVT